MHRFYLPPAQCTGEILCLQEGEAHHAMRVLRVQRGEQVLVLDGAGREFACQVQDCSAKQVSLQVLSKRTSAPPLCSITLLQALPKGKLIETIIEKATELGAARVVPLLSERVVVHLDSQERLRKAAKWQQVAVEAIKQCGALWLPKVEVPLSPAEFLARNEAVDLPLVGSLQPNSPHPRQHFQAFVATRKRLPASASLWIGPEGDFSPQELASIQAAGTLPITLGPLVLRTDTAALYSLSFLNYELQAPSAPSQAQ